MSYRRLAESLLQRRPYFGPALRSLQGVPDRQRYFLPIVKIMKEHDNVQILEIGSWAGASAISWASALQKLGISGRVTCVDAWEPYFDLDKDKSLHYERMNRAAAEGLIYRLFQHNVEASGFEKMIVAKVGASRDVLPQLPAGRFHIVYLDGSHIWENVAFDIREAKRLVHAGGIICGDDLEAQLQDMDVTEVEPAALLRQDYVLSSLGMHYHPGVTLAVGSEFGRVSAWEGFWAVRESTGDWSDVTLDLAGSEIPDHIADGVNKIEGSTPTHHLISHKGRYAALAKSLGPPDIVAELLGVGDIPPLIVTGGSLQEVQEKVAANDSSSIPDLVGSYRGYNLVRFKGNTYGLRQALGIVDFSAGAESILDRYSESDALIGDTPDGIRARIDAAAMEQQQVVLAKTLADQIAIVRAGLPAFEDPSQALLSIEERVTAIRDGLRSFEDRNQALQSIEEQVSAVRALLRSLEDQVASILRTIADDRSSCGLGNGPPQLLEWYRDFKLVRFGHRVYGIRGVLGDVDVLLGETLLEARYSGEDVLIGDSTDGVKTRIDAVETERRVQQLSERIGDLERSKVQA